MIVDADGHVRELDERIYEYLEGRYGQLVHDPTHRFFPSVGPSALGLRDPAVHDVKSIEVDGDVWLEALEEFGIDSAVLFPTAGLGHGQIRNPDWACALARAYNRWAQDTYGRVSPRLKPVAILPVQDVAAAAAELRFAVTELGMVAGFLPAGNCINEPFGHPDFDPIWAEAERLGVPIALHAHTGDTQWLTLHLFDTRGAKIHALSHPFKNIVQLTSIVMDGVFERFPGVRLACLESGSTWVLGLMDRLDYEHHREKRNARPALPRKPSAYIREHVYVTCDLSEGMLPATIERFGADHLMFASDFPHDARAWIHDEMAEFGERTDVTEETKRKILGENAARFFGLAPAKMTAPGGAG